MLLYFLSGRLTNRLGRITVSCTDRYISTCAAIQLLQLPQISFATNLLKPRTFLALLQDGDTEFGDLTYHKQVRWPIQEVATHRCVNTSSEVLPCLEDLKNPTF